MTIYAFILFALWLILLGFWVISAFSAKRTVRGMGFWTSISARIIILVAVIVLLHIPLGLKWFQDSAGGLLSSSPIVRSIGLLIAALGVALAIWARVYLGRNWGMPMSHKESPELVTTGPYKYIRHPIYTGFLAAVIGSSLAENGLWLIVLVVMGAYFVYSATREQKIMTAEFPDQYPAYKARTKMFIPFIF